MRHLLIVLAMVAVPLALQPATALAEEPEDSGGTLNPEEMSLNAAVAEVLRGDTSMVNCAHGYHLTKWGKHDQARLLLERCAEAGYAGAMTWMAQLDDNGLGAEENPEAAAAWDLRAAETGDPIGQFNYGLDLLRGRGVPLDEEQGRAYVDAAAEAGLPEALRLQAAEYDLDEVTPDADNWKYDKLLY